MTSAPLPRLISVSFVLFFVILFSLLLMPSRPVAAGPRADTYWSVDDVRTGMKGIGRTVLRGTKIETFQVEVLGVLKNTSPGRDLILARLSGLNLDKTGVIAGMSGSPVYVDNKLLGAVSYAWPFGKEPIAGITPFSQMARYVEAYERRDLAGSTRPTRVGLAAPVTIDGKDFSAVTVSSDWQGPTATAADELWLTPLRTPLAATGFSQNSLKLLRDRCGQFGLVPMQGGGAAANVADEAREVAIEPGGSLAIALVSGDFDLSGIGTVTHVEGKRVYGWGHPFMSLGSCDFPLMTGYIHTVYPRQTVSFKMGSPLQCVGVINADVSTCIAGWMGRKPDLVPVCMRVTLGPEEEARTFRVRLARQQTLLPSLLMASLTNSLDMEGELPEEMTAELEARIHVADHEPILIKDTYSGFTGGRAPQALYTQVGALTQLLTHNPFKAVRIEKIECSTHVRPGRQTAEIEAVELGSDTYEPGETVRAVAFVRPYKGQPQRVPLALKLPADLPEGPYVATVCNDLLNAQMTLRDNPTLTSPTDLSQVFQAVRVQTQARRTNLALRVPTGPSGVAVSGKALPELPSSMVQILGNSRRTGAQVMSSALVSRRPTEWVILGSETVRFTVTRNKKFTND